MWDDDDNLEGVSDFEYGIRRGFYDWDDIGDSDFDDSDETGGFVVFDDDDLGDGG